MFVQGTAKIERKEEKKNNEPRIYNIVYQMTVKSDSALFSEKNNNISIGSNNYDSIV